MRLAINIDHIATLRNARGGTDPDPVSAARVAERAGADGIVCHLREDRRHIRDSDVRRLRESVATKLDLEMAATKEIISFACKIRPELVTLVPEKRRELTTEGGLDVIRQRRYLKSVIDRFHQSGILVSLFIDPVRNQIETAKDIGADMIEIHTGEYANAYPTRNWHYQLKRITMMANFAKSLGLTVNAGHGLDYNNIKKIASIHAIEEVSIGHAVIVQAVNIGLGEAVKEMIKLVQGKKK